MNTLNRTRTLKRSLLTALTACSLNLSIPLALHAQDASEKIRLMADALQARDAGDFVLAKSYAESLYAIAPNDSNVQLLLDSINEKIASESVDNATADSIEVVETVEAEVEVPEPVAPIAPAESVELSEEEKALNAAKALVEAGDLLAAEAVLEDYLLTGQGSRAVVRLLKKVDAALSDPSEQNMLAISEDYLTQRKIIRDLTARGRAQFLNGDYAGAAASFKEVEARDPNDAEAKLFQLRIAEMVGDVQKQNLYKTRAQMLAEVEQAWERPKVFEVDADINSVEEVDNSIQRKMNSIVIPQVNFSGMELTRVIESLSELSAEYDPDRIGVNIVPLFGSEQKNPQVNISLRNLSLDRILQFVTQQVSFSYDIGSDAVTVSPSDSPGGVSTTVTEFFPISRATVIRLTGFSEVGGGGGGADFDPFAAPDTSAPAAGGGSGDKEVEALQGFFQRAGVNFEMAGASLAFDGEQLIVTQTRRNLERMRVILRNYNEVKQVEIESKFLEVSQSDLDELGFDWSVTKNGNAVYTNQNRTLSGAHGGGDASQGVTINESSYTELSTVVDIDPFFGTTTTTNASFYPGVSQSFGQNVPVITGTVDLAQTAGNLLSGHISSPGNYNIDLAIRALSRKTGSDLMSAPKVTVLSGKRANIVVAQEMLYPESYSDIESTVSANNGGSAISITAATPQDFTKRNVGVELSVTPNVENDDTISLILEPRVTEFEGFVEFGGPSVALSGRTTVMVPPGFYQPIFSTREITTEVTVFDGATVVMGGLTRDEVRTVNDRVPILGDIPGVGRLFRSEGETRQKRNLLIFVTANLVSPGGSPARQNYRSVNANSLFQNPTIMTPAGTVSRGIDTE
jgi:general secretion pathway protein D